MLMLALFLTVCETFAKQEKWQNFDLENEGQRKGVEEWDLCYSTRNVRVQIGDFFQNFSYLGSYVYAKGCTHSHTHIQTKTTRDCSDDYRKNLQSTYAKKNGYRRMILSV